MLSLGLFCRGKLRGSYYLLDAPLEDRALSVELAADIVGLRGLVLAKQARLLGRIHAEGLAPDAVAEGTLGLRLIDEGRLPLSLSFRGDDGGAYRLRGQSELVVAAPVETVTELPLSLYDGQDREIGRGLLRFDVRGDLGKLLRSFRVRAHLGDPPA